MSKGFYDDDIYNSKEKEFNYGISEAKSFKALDKYNVGDFITIKIMPTVSYLYKKDNGFAVYECKEIIDNKNDKSEGLKISGFFVAPLTLNHTYQVTGEVIDYKGEKSLQVKKPKKILPTNKDSVIGYLGTLSEIGMLSELIYSVFGNESVRKILEEPSKIKELSPSIYDGLVEKWQQELSSIKDNQRLLEDLKKYNIDYKDARKLYEIYKDNVISRIKENPYVLAKDLYGYGFKNCDKIAQKMNFDIKSHIRIKEGIVEVLRQASNRCHTYLPQNTFFKEVIKLLNVSLTINEMKSALKTNKKHYIKTISGKKYKVSMDKIKKSLKLKKEKDKNKYNISIVKFEVKEILPVLKELIFNKRIVIDNKKIYLRHLYEAEENIAFNINSINKNIKKEKFEEHILEEYIKEENIELEVKQKEAINNSLYTHGGIQIINGSAGTGKTFTVNLLLKILEKEYRKEGYYYETMVLAPTGKAAKVISRATGREAMTIHRALGYDGKGGYQYHSGNKFPVDCIVVDESTMLDTELMDSFLQAIPYKAKLILMGDTKQLASIGAGNVFNDLIDSGEITVTTLDVTKRQGEKSKILDNAKKIINKEMITTYEGYDDVVIDYINENYIALNKAKEYFKDEIKGKNILDVQLLAPQKNSMIGVDNLNKEIQKIYNKKNSKYQFRNKRAKYCKLYFKLGDKIMHVKNNYNLQHYKLVDKKLKAIPKKLGVVNGEIGIIVKMLKGKNEDGDIIEKMIVKYDFGFIIYEDDFTEINHAYALTIHKSQGSEWDTVISVITNSSFRMLDNNLIYTLYTRARIKNITIAEYRALKYGIKNEKVSARLTGLKEKVIKLKKKAIV